MPSRRRRGDRPVGCEVLPDLPDNLGIDRACVGFLGLLLRVEHELDRSAGRCKRARIEYVESLINGIGFRNPLFELERVDWGDLDIAAERAHPQET